MIATGGSGEVWRGRLHRQNEEERIVAIKKCIIMNDDVYHEEVRDSDDGEDDVVRNSKDSLWEDGEIKLLMLVRHERLVSFLGAGEVGGYRFLVVELMSGGSIEKKLWGKSKIYTECFVVVIILTLSSYSSHFLYSSYIYIQVLL